MMPECRAISRAAWGNDYETVITLARHLEKTHIFEPLLHGVEEMAFSRLGRGKEAECARQKARDCICLRDEYAEEMQLHPTEPNHCLVSAMIAMGLDAFGPLGWPG